MARSKSSSKKRNTKGILHTLPLAFIAITLFSLLLLGSILMGFQEKTRSQRSDAYYVLPLPSPSNTTCILEGFSCSANHPCCADLGCVLDSQLGIICKRRVCEENRLRCEGKYLQKCRDGQWQWQKTCQSEIACKFPPIGTFCTISNFCLINGTTRCSTDGTRLRTCQNHQWSTFLCDKGCVTTLTGAKCGQ